MTHVSTRLGDWALLAIKLHTSKIFHYEARVLQDNDPEDLHQIRVGMRRLRTAMVGFQGALKLPKNMTQQKIGRMGRVFGAQRDNDVLQEILRNRYYPQLPEAEQAVLDTVLKYLKKERKQALKNTRKLLRHDRFANFKHQWQQWLAEPQFTPLAQVPLSLVLPDLLLPQLSEFFLHPGLWLGTSPTASDALPPLPAELDSLLDQQEPILHDLRKAAKRTRYQMELFTDCYGDYYQTLLHQVKKAQTILGDLQDSYVLRGRIEDCLGGTLPDLSPELFILFQTERRQAWEGWLPLQQQFLDSTYRQQCRQLLNS